jgi:hypothetical protein
MVIVPLSGCCRQSVIPSVTDEKREMMKTCGICKAYPGA